MEPADLNSSSRDDARLEALLRRSATTLPDDGFSARVLAALPPPSQLAAPSDARWHVALAGGLAGTVFALGGVFLRPNLGTNLADSLVALGQSMSILADPMCLLAFGITALSLFYVFRPAPRHA